jgi:hypothetical protein
VTPKPPTNVTLRNALLLGTLNGLLIDATFNLEIDACFIVFIRSCDMVVFTSSFPEEQSCPSFDGQTNQMLPAINLRVNMWKPGIGRGPVRKEVLGTGKKNVIMAACSFSTNQSGPP